MHRCTDNQADLCRDSKHSKTKLGPITAVIGVVRRDKHRARSSIELRVELTRLSLTQANNEAQLMHRPSPVRSAIQPGRRLDAAGPLRSLIRNGMRDVVSGMHDVRRSAELRIAASMGTREPRCSRTQYALADKESTPEVTRCSAPMNPALRARSCGSQNPGPATAHRLIPAIPAGSAGPGPFEPLTAFIVSHAPCTTDITGSVTGTADRYASPSLFHFGPVSPSSVRTSLCTQLRPARNPVSS